jgi:hypothetical protein
LDVGKYEDIKYGDFDDDDEHEFLVLKEDELVLYNFYPLEILDDNRIVFPSFFKITAAYPNPFNSSATIEYALPVPGEVSVKVFDLAGAEVARLARGWRTAGRFATVWDASGMPSGTYLVKLDGLNGRDAKVVQLVK